MGGANTKQVQIKAGMKPGDLHSSIQSLSVCYTNLYLYLSVIFLVPINKFVTTIAAVLNDVIDCKWVSPYTAAKQTDN